MLTWLYKLRCKIRNLDYYQEYALDCELLSLLEKISPTDPDWKEMFAQATETPAHWWPEIGPSSNAKAFNFECKELTVKIIVDHKVQWMYDSHWYIVIIHTKDPSEYIKKYYYYGSSDRAIINQNYKKIIQYCNRVISGISWNNRVKEIKRHTALIRKALEVIKEGKV